MKTLIFILISFSSISLYAQNKDSIELANFIDNGPKELKTITNHKTNDTELSNAISEYNVFVFKHRIKAYKWQLLSSKIIFGISIIIVLVGLYLSYLQFRSSISSVEKKKSSKVSGLSNNTSENQAASATTFQIGKEGLKIHSTVIGLIILVFSIVFFFLYLKFIFHINDLGF